MPRHVGRLVMVFAAAAALLAIAAPSPAQPSADEIRIWPGAAPGTEDWTGEETSGQTQVPAGTIRIRSNVTVPTLTMVRPEAGRANGTAMLVLPGGVFSVLAWDLEGTEVARWLADRGITAFVLKYRVRPPQLAPGQAPPTSLDELVRVLEPGRRIAVADAAQAVRFLRAHAGQYGIRPDRIGMIGFSAGAITTVGAALQDDAASRPDFAASIYGMTMMQSPTVPEGAPPLFIVHAQDDTTIPPTGSTDLFTLWTAAHRPAELHIYTHGGHGFGVRPSNLPVAHWPDSLGAWLGALGALQQPQPAAAPH